ncbi:MAG TPA: C25 family peptidase propeptide domain-containing protein, partial [Bacteroidota bacterium]|nr:C25 family peptidase propeptide domain-containing protein [Bacteroidota bacterium]
MIGNHTYKHSLLIRTFLLMSVGSLFLLTCRAGQDKDIHILQSDASGVVVEYIPAFCPAEKIMVDGQTMFRYSFHGAATEPKQRSGSPEFLERAVLLRFPGIKGNSVELLHADYDDSTNVRIAPVPFYRKDEAGPAAVYSMNAAAYTASGMLPEKIVSLSNVAESRGVFLGDVMIQPYQYNAVLHVVRKYKRIVFRVGFGPAEPVRPNTLPVHIAVNDQSLVSSGKVSSIAKKATVQ